MKNIHLVIFSIATMFFSSCGNKNESSKPTAFTPIALEAFSILDADNDGLSMNDNGICFFNKDTIAIINSEGKIFNKSNELVAFLKDNKLIDTLGNQISEIKNDGNFSIENVSATWNSSGKLVRQNEITNFTLKPNNQKTQITASILFSTFSMRPFDLLDAPEDIDEISIEDLEKEFNQ